MRILIINSVCGIRSTGRICTDLAKDMIDDGHEVRIAYGRNRVSDKYKNITVRIGNDLSIGFSGLYTRFTGKHGFSNNRETKKFLLWAEKYDPDVLWLHNLHGYYINIEMLFDWIKSRPSMKVKWTLHDCWAFTGHCAHFAYAGCNKWMTQCFECGQIDQYPKSFVSNCEDNFKRKKRAFLGVDNMVLICPSKWLADHVKKSFLKEYPIEIEHNKINKSVFKSTDSDFRVLYRLTDKRVVLGVATSWSERKGLDDLIELSTILDDSYQLVLIGLTKKQMRTIPNNIICLPRTDSVEKLAMVYSAADVFVNPSKEEVFGLTTIEALACGTPAVVYKHTACEEIAQSYNGIVVEQSVYAMKTAIENICNPQD